MTIRFDDAWVNALTGAKVLAESGTDVVVIRDMLGRISLLVDGDDLDSDAADRFVDGLGRFASPSPVIRASDLFAPESVLSAPDLRVRMERAGNRGRVCTLERSVVGADWYRPALDSSGVRLAMYGFKGGVGRSTATAILAKHLAQNDKCVLVVDLDLESPGVGGLLGPDTLTSKHGIVDHLVESAVHNQDGLELVVPIQFSDVAGNGEVWLAPAEGLPSEKRNYAAKLNRVYTDLPQGMRFGERLHAAVTAAEDQVGMLSRKPDVVLMDSRAGIHDIAAVAITQLADLSLLFATNNSHTWHGYGTLFQQWKENLSPESLDRIRRRLKMVASMVPPNEAERYLEGFRDNAQTCFAESLYDESISGEDVDAFNFAPGDLEAPHSPSAILFNSDLVGLDAQSQIDWHAQPLVRAAYDQFLSEASELVEGAVK